MTPQEKARELVSRFRSAIYEGVLTTANVDLKREAYRDEQGKRCALVSVDEMISNSEIDSDQKYWYSVKEELKRMN